MQPTDKTPNPRSRLLSLVFTDLADSVGLKSRLGDTEAVRIIDSHHSAVRRLCEACGGREVLVAGDGAFLVFETPTLAVSFALNLQDHHRQMTALPECRIGIHMGEVTERFSGAGALQVEGLAVDIASRIQGLAKPRQILMSYAVFDNARQRLDNSQWTLPVEWRAHGRYIFQGTDLPLEIYEVGLKGVAAFVPPLGSTKAARDAHVEEEETLGWRPAHGLELPARPNWILKEKLGEGGFGDVWLAEHCKTREPRVVKFCYSSAHLRTLKREVTLFRLLKEALGQRDDIVRVLDYRFDAPPYFFEMEYAGKYTLAEWLDSRGGACEVALEVRLELVAQVADAIAAAHSVGVIHKDIKPSNIIVVETAAGHPQIRMIDFGIGGIPDRGAFDSHGITLTGLTETSYAHSDGSSLTGTRLYMAPEIIEGRPATIRSDIYALGVLLYQMISGKLGQTIGIGWDRDIHDELLREDISSCVDVDPEKRLRAAEELTIRLRSLPERRARLLAVHERRIAEQRRKLRAQRLRMGAILLGLIGTMLLFLLGVFAWAQGQKATTEATLRQRAEQARELAQIQSKKTAAALDKAQQARYFGAIALAEASLRESRLDKAQEVLLEEAPRKLYKREWGWLLAQTEPEDFALTNHNFYDAVFSPDGDEFAIGSRDVSGAGYVATYSTYSGDRVSSAVTNKQIVWNLAFSPDGKYIATASNDSHVSILDRQTNKVVKSLGRKQIVRDVQFSPDGKLLAACARDKTVRLWTVPDFQTSLTIYLQNESPTELSFSPDSRYLVLGNLEGHPRIYDLAASAAAHSFAVKKTSGTQTAAAAPAQNTYGVEVCKLGGKMERVLACTFLGDGKGLAVGSTDGRTFIYNWPPRPGKRVLQPRHVILSDGSYPTQVASSPDGQVLYIGNDNGHIMAVNTQTGEEILSFTVDQPLWKMSLCRGGHRLLTTTRWSVRMFNLDRLRDEVRISPVDLGSSQTSGAIPIRAATVFNPRDKTWSADTEWRTTSGLSLVETNSRRKFLVKSDYLVHSPDGKQAVKIDPETLHWRAFETSSGKTLNSNGRHLCTGAVFSPDSKLCLIQYDRTKSVLYRTRDWSVVYEIVPKISVSSSIFTRDSKKLIVGDIDGQIVERDAATGAVLRQLLPPRSGNALDMAISRRENLLAVGLDLDRAIVIDLDTGDQISTMTGHVRYIHALAFAPDETRLVTMSRDSTVKMWDIATGRELVTLFRFKDGVVPLGISFSANGRRISVVTSDRQLVGTDVFPWSLKAYGNDHLPPVERVELWKRRQRLPLLKRK